MFELLEKYTPWLDLIYFGNTLRQYLVALGILLVSWIFIFYLKQRLLSFLKRWSRRTDTDLDDEMVAVLEKIPGPLYIFASLFFALKVLIVPAIVDRIIQVILVILLVFWAGKVASQLIEFILYKLAKQKGDTQRQKNTTYFALNLIAKMLLWSTGLLLILSNLGVNISALIASLGIGGIAVALAVQNVLGDMFSSFTIYFDKPFGVGDYIIVGQHEGTVKNIGLKSTRIEALQGEEIVISNNELTSTRIRNFKRMKKRRIAFQIGVTYETKSAKLSKIPQLIEGLMKKIDMIEFDRTHFKSFEESSLMFEIVYYINSSLYKDYMDKQQEINLAIVKTFEKEVIEMAFPTRTVYMKKA